MSLVTSTSLLYLLPDVLLFGFIVVLCFLEVLNTHKVIKKDLNVSTGMEIRKWFHFVLFLGVFGRFLSLTAQLVFFNHQIVCPNTLECLVTRTMPELFFLTLYSVLILFYAQLSNIASGTTFRFLRVLFVLLNVVYYLGYLVALIWFHSSLAELLPALYYLFGFYYLVTLICLFYYGPYVTGTIMTGTATKPGQSRVPKRVVSRFVAVMMLYAVVMIIRLMYYLGNATDIFGWEDGTPPQTDPYFFETISVGVCEFLPACIVLYIMRRRKTRYVMGQQRKLSGISPITERSGLVMHNTERSGLVMHNVTHHVTQHASVSHRSY